MHTPVDLQGDEGMEHGGRGFRAGRTKLSTARIANFRWNRTGEYHTRRPTTSKLLFAHLGVPIVCEFLEAFSRCRDCSGSSPDDFGALSRKVAVDLGIESPDVMRPGLIEGGFLAKSQSTMLVVHRVRGFLGHGRSIVDQVWRKEGC